MVIRKDTTHNVSAQYLQYSEAMLNQAAFASRKVARTTWVSTIPGAMEDNL